MRRRVARKTLAAALMLTSAIGAGWVMSTPAQAQSAAVETVDFKVPAGPLNQALAAFGRQSGLQVTYLAASATGKTSPGITGRATRDEALARILAGSGLAFSFPNATTAAIGAAGSPAAPVATDGSTVLDVIDVTGGGGGIRSAEQVFETPAAVSYISQQTIERFRGSSPGDIFRGTPGVMSAESRNGAAIDINIRGMQGMGRVPVTIDGAMNSTTAYQGYQGVSNRSYVDPDLIGGIDISKGPASGPFGGIGGSVAMRTIDANDIIKDGKNIGLRIKGGVGTNTSSVPDRGTLGGMIFFLPNIGLPPRPGDAAGLDKPGLLEATRGYGSAAAAARGDNYEVVAAYARRENGNYHAGTHGPVAAPSGNLGPVQVCDTFGCQTQNNVYKNLGLTNYRRGEEVLNTSLDTESWLAKGKLLFGDGQSFELGYTGFRSEQGDIRASIMSDMSSRPVQNWLARARTDTGTATYAWNPQDNDLVDLKARLWVSALETRNPTTAGRSKTTPLGLPNPLLERILIGSDTLMWGGDIGNTSLWQTPLGDVSLHYGASYLSEDARPTELTRVLEYPYGPRNGTREETAVYANAEWKALDWLTFDAGLRYQSYNTLDRSEARDTNGKLFIGQTDHRDGSGIAPAIGAVVTPMDGMQLFARYSEGLRSPALSESASMAFTYVTPDIVPERAHNWELGMNLMRDNVVATGDEVWLKLGWFDNRVTDYIARRVVDLQYTGGIVTKGLAVGNIDEARFRGIEFTGHYALAGLSLDLAANYYTDIEFCPTASTCSNSTLYGDYATNQVPPEYSVSLTVSQKLFDEALTIGGRVSYIGPKAIGSDQPTVQGAAPFILPINWDPYTLVDLFAEYKVNDTLTAELRVENVADQYYVDPLGLSNVPGPGRTIWAGLTANF
ncbi:TonB-dependent receptor [Kaistia sp. 32K]|uniref:TonB-dependent receptor n=1 Tax=Kaistia sp. 32K TaxID=2795690 RepID=UPI00191610F2|nr:TonB-dependent receptor [Kaistia sp. 32K]